MYKCVFRFEIKEKNMKKLRGTALYCGIGTDINTMEKHLKEASEAGINAMFTSLQLPEADVAQTLRDFPKMAEIAHRYGILVDADIATRTATRFGIDMFDVSAIKALGIDIARYDGGCTTEKLVELTHNKVGLIIDLNAATVTREELDKFESLGINKENSHFCHNYYPMRYTGLKPEDAARKNAMIHEYGYRVAGFIPSRAHRRIGCSIGLPTVERERDMNAFTAVTEALTLGFDDLFFGDDLASRDELKTLAEASGDVVTFRIETYEDSVATEWLVDRVIDQIQDFHDEIIRSHFGRPESLFPGGYDGGLARERHRGDITIASSRMWRYSGEVQIARMDLPFDPDMRIVARVIDEDLPLLDTFHLGPRRPFRFIKAN